MEKKLKSKTKIIIIMSVCISFIFIMNSMNYIKLNKLFNISADIQKNINEIGIAYTHEIKRYVFANDKELNQNDSFEYFAKLHKVDDLRGSDFVKDYTYQHHFPWHKISDIFFSIEDEKGIFVFRDKYFLNIPLYTTIDYIFVCKDDSDYYLYNILFLVPVYKGKKIIDLRMK